MSTRNVDSGQGGTDVPVRRIDRVLAYSALALIALAVACFFAVMLAQPMGVKDFSEGLWPAIMWIQMWALPLGFVLIVVLLIMSFQRRSRANKADGASGGSRTGR